MIERIVNNMTSNNFKNTFHNNNLLKKSFIFSLNVVLTCFLKRIIDASKSSFTAPLLNVAMLFTSAGKR